MSSGVGPTFELKFSNSDCSATTFQADTAKIGDLLGWEGVGISTEFTFTDFLVDKEVVDGGYCGNHVYTLYDTNGSSPPPSWLTFDDNTISFTSTTGEFKLKITSAGADVTPTPVDVKICMELESWLLSDDATHPYHCEDFTA